MKKILFFSALVCYFNLSAQQDPNVLKEAQNQLVFNQALNDGYALSAGAGITNSYSLFSGPIRDLRYSGLKGSPYLFNKWEDGLLLMNDGKLRKLPIKYNMCTKYVEVKQGGDSIGVYPYQIKGFKINDPQNNADLVFLKVEHLKTSYGEVPISFLMAIYNNKVGLFKHFNKDILRADFKDAYSAGRTYDSYQDYSEYFFKKSDNTFVKLKFTKKSLLNAMNDKEEAVKKFLDDKKINSEADVVDVIKYYESL